MPTPATASTTCAAKILGHAVARGLDPRALLTVADLVPELLAAREARMPVARVVALPPFWGRSGFTDSIPNVREPSGADIPGMPSTFVAGVLVGVLAAVLAVIVVRAQRRSDSSLVWLGATSGAAVAVALGTMVIMPLGPLGLTVHQMRWLWPISALVTATLVVAVARELGARRTAGAASPMAVTAAVVIAGLFALLAVPYHLHPAGSQQFVESMPVVRDLWDATDALEDRGTVLFDPTGLRFAEPYSGVLLAALAARDIDLVVDDPGLVRQLGDRRRHRGDADVRIWLVEGETARQDPPDGVERVVFVDGTSRQDREALAAERDTAARRIVTEGLLLTDAGREATGGLIDGVENPMFPTPEEVDRLIRTGVMRSLVDAGHVVISDETADALAAVSARQDVSATLTVAVWLAPLTGVGP